MVVIKKSLIFLSLMSIAQLASASLVIDPFSSALPTTISPVPSATQVLANADRFLTRTGGGDYNLWQRLAGVSCRCEPDGQFLL